VILRGLLLYYSIRRKDQFAAWAEWRSENKISGLHFRGFFPKLLFLTIILNSGFWPRVRARALRAPVFLGSLPRQLGRSAPPAHHSFAASYSSAKNVNLLFTEPCCTLLGYVALTKLHCTILCCAAHYWAKLHPSGLHSTLLICAAPYWATLHPIWAMLDPKSYAAPSELSCTHLSLAAPFWATLPPSELCCTLLSYALPI
jgi:hypothetical protein